MSIPSLRRLLPALAALALAAPIVGAEEPATSHPLHTWKRVWSAGAVRTVRAQAQLKGLVRAESMDQATGQPQTFEQNLLEEENYSYVQRCDAADSQGEATAFRVYISEWNSRDEEGQADASLTGAHVEVKVLSGAYSWKLLNAAEEPTRLAQKWLEKRFGAKRKGDEGLDLGRLGAPQGPVKVGDSWAGNILFMDDSMPLTKERSRVELRLAAVADGVAQIPVSIRLQMQGFPLGEGLEGALLPWTEGGLLEGTGETRVALASGSYAGGNSFQGALRGVAEATDPKAEGLKITLQADMKGSVETVSGGVIPELKPAEPRFGTQPPR